ncbi:hypothetical protein [Geomicrobium sp. JCM 19039]|uniref:hypothetical protein n=1 Tax=Geomicrobium sp. JCM 19039 TaxID=1460636 RepID=UPI00045F4BD4|nr:hypothetical protein [Geomicrobium sp. JCM 19039]GAK12413.1 hypothetical protein JCM19039_2184 [Geomicrobium sp. JCM 19039]
MKKLLITMGALAFILGGCNEGAGDVQEPVGDTFEDSGGSSASMIAGILATANLLTLNKELLFTKRVV